ncbi:hypothetical protein GC176_02840 [bacterium]|nr:hypothetical protein [bacterium]
MKKYALTVYLLLAAVLISQVSPVRAQEQAADIPARKLLLAHYMPWYVAKPFSDVWGWHWTMNHFDPEQQTNGRRAIASHFYPLIGPYDSGDRDVIECHLLTMKLAGIDGVIVDWYGLTDFRDYATLHRNTTRVLQECERLKMKFVICYEDQTIPALVKGGRLAANDPVSHAVSELEWLDKYWFKSPSYVCLDGKPVLLSFGHAGLTDDEWSQCLDRLQVPVAYFSEHSRRRRATGAFDWPIPSQGLIATEKFQKAAADWPHSIPTAFPRFVDVYKEAGLHDGYGRIDDDRGQTFRTSLRRTMNSKANLVQIATWNDWGEGTIIEPSIEFGYRDLQLIQSLRRSRDELPAEFNASDLRLPTRLLELRRKADSPDESQRLDRIAESLAAGQMSAARQQLD